MNYILLNGKLIPKSKALIEVTNKGYFFDFAVYSSIKIIKSKPFFLQYHIDRLFESAKLIDLKHSYTKKQIINWFKKFAEKNKIEDALVRILLIGDPDKQTDTKLFIIPITGITYYPNHFYTKGIKTITYQGQRRIPGAKTKDMLLGFLAKRVAQKADAHEALIVDFDGNIREGSSSNFFAIKKNTLITPPPEKILPGITRKIVLEVAKKDFKIIEQDIPLKHLKKYDELFITSTLRNVMPIRQINDIQIATTFPKTKLLQKLYKDYCKKI